jgi:dipeptide/tripeptide permease
VFIIFVGAVLGVMQTLLNFIIVDKEESKFKKMYDTAGASYYFRGSMIFFIVIIVIAIISFLDIITAAAIQRMFLVSLIIALALRAYMEWKYLRNTNQHKATLILLGTLLLFSVFFFLLK